MGFFFTFLIALAVSILFFAILYALILRGIRAEKRVGWLFLAFIFFVVFLPTWAGGLWLKPFGPRLGGASVLGYVLVGVAVALILAAILPRPKAEPQTVRSPDEPRLSREEVLEGQRYDDWSKIGWFFGIFFIFMIAAIVLAAI